MSSSSSGRGAQRPQPSTVPQVMRHYNEFLERFSENHFAFLRENAARVIGTRNEDYANAGAGFGIPGEQVQAILNGGVPGDTRQLKFLVQTAKTLWAPGTISDLVLWCEDMYSLRPPKDDSPMEDMMDGAAVSQAPQIVTSIDQKREQNVLPFDLMKVQAMHRQSDVKMKVNAKVRSDGPGAQTLPDLPDSTVKFLSYARQAAQRCLYRLAEAIRFLMNKRGMTANELASRTHLPLSRINEMYVP